MEIHERIKARRLALGLNADDVAEAIGVSRATVYRYESKDIEKLPLDILAPLAKVLKTTPSYLMGWDDDDTASPSQNPPSERKDDTVQVHIMDFHGKEPEVITIPREKYEKMQRLLRAYEAEEEREKKNDPGIF